MDYPAQMRDDAQDMQITDLSRKVDLLFSRTDDVRTCYTELRTVVLGVEGQNGIRGSVRQLRVDIELGKTEMRRMERTFLDAIDELRKETEAVRKQRKAEMIGMSSLFVAFIGLLVRLVL